MLAFLQSPCTKRPRAAVSRYARGAATSQLRGHTSGFIGAKVFAAPSTFRLCRNSKMRRARTTCDLTDPSGEPKAPASLADKSTPAAGDSSAPSVESSGTTEPAQPPKVRGIPERTRVVLLCFASFVICNCDRINISVAILPMAQTFGWSQSTVGLVQSAFFWGYVTTQIPGGYLSDRYGGRQVLAFGVIAWSLMTFLTPLAASTSLPWLLVARALLGVGEGVAMPAMNQIVSRWVPRSERSASLSLIYSGMYLGSVVGLLSCPFLIAQFGWPSVFYVFGALGAVWWGGWHFLTSGSPELSQTISAEEREYITRSTISKPPSQLDKVPWKMLLGERATWAIIVAHFCCTWGTYSIESASIATVLPGCVYRDLTLSIWSGYVLVLC